MATLRPASPSPLATARTCSPTALPSNYYFSLSLPRSFLSLL
jgi:hypothetical protein